MTVEEGRELLASRFPELTRAPARMFGEDGSPLPPTKKEELSAGERDARKAALQVVFRGKRKHSLVKAFVILESRISSWKRVGSVQARNDQVPLTKLLNEELPTPWQLPLEHDLDSIERNTKARRHFELPDSRVNCACLKCSGTGSSACGTCRGEPADECWWCAGSGREKKKGIECARCHGHGTLNCDSCKGTLTGTCTTCDGKGSGEYAVWIEVRIRRIDFRPVPVAALLPGVEPTAYNRGLPIDDIRNAAVRRTFDLMRKLAQTSVAKGKHPFVPVAAACSLENSVSHLAQIDHPTVRSVLPLSLRKKRSAPQLRSSSSYSVIDPNKAPYAGPPRHFIIPSDPDLQPAAMNADDFAHAIATDVSKLEFPTRALLEAIAVETTGGFNPAVTSPLRTSSTNMASSTATARSIARRGSITTTDVLPTPGKDEAPMNPLPRSYRPQVSPLNQLVVMTPSNSLPGTPTMSTFAAQQSPAPQSPITPMAALARASAPPAPVRTQAPAAPVRASVPVAAAHTCTCGAAAAPVSVEATPTARRTAPTPPPRNPARISYEDTSVASEVIPAHPLELSPRQAFYGPSRGTRPLFRQIYQLGSDGGAGGNGAHSAPSSVVDLTLVN